MLLFEEADAKLIKPQLIELIKLLVKTGVA
jgi:hypothetical protein